MGLFRKSLLFLAFNLLSRAQNPPGTISPLTSNCHPSPNVLCINKYASVLPYHFYRFVPVGSTPVPFGATIVGAPPANNETAVPASNHSIANNSFASGAVANAEFLVFDEAAGTQILGPNPTNEFMFKVSDAVHEAPIFVPSLNRLYFSILAPPPGTLPQLLLNLNADPPTLENFVSDPPVYAPNGGTFHNGLLYFAASGGNDSIGGTEQRPGIRTVDPVTNKSVTLLDNYFGYYFNGPDDIVVDPKGDVWFTDPYYAWFNSLTDEPPQLPAATWRFRPSTGAVSAVDTSIQLPNGIALSPGGDSMYISDTGAVQGVFSRQPDSADIHGSHFNNTQQRAVFKFDVLDDGMTLGNKRPIWLSQDFIPDGLKTAANGMVVTATGLGVDVLDPVGTLLVRVQTNYTVQNFAWVAGPNKDMTELWIMGNGGVSRVRWALAGPVLV